MSISDGSRELGLQTDMVHPLCELPLRFYHVHSLDIFGHGMGRRW